MCLRSIAIRTQSALHGVNHLVNAGGKKQAQCKAKLPDVPCMLRSSHRHLSDCHHRIALESLPAGNQPRTPCTCPLRVLLGLDMIDDKVLVLQSLAPCLVDRVTGQA